MSEMNRANTIIRDSLGGAFSQIVVDDEAMYHEIQTTSVRSNRRARNS